MSINMTIKSGTTRTFPQEGDSDLFGQVTSWASDVTNAINASPILSQTATFDAVVGSAANVTAGIATHSDIITAIAAVSANDRIYILENTHVPAAIVDINKALTIIGQGEGAIIAGNNIAAGAVVKISATGVTFQNVKITQGTGTPDYALEIAAAIERTSLDIKADGTFATSLVLNGSVAGATTGFISYDTNSVFFGGESQYVEQVKIEDQTTPAYNLVIQADSNASVMTADRILTFDVNNAARMIDMKGNLVISGNLITVGDDSVTLTTSAATDVTLPTTGTLATLDGMETLTQKTLTSPDINGGTADSLTNLSIRSSGAAFDLEFDTSEVLTGNKAIHWNVGDTNRNVTLEGDLDLTGNFSTVGDDDVILTTTADTNITLPTTGTVSTLDGMETLTTKTLTSPDINGGTADSLTNLSIRSSGAAFDLEFDTSEVITANRAIHWNVANADRNVTLSADLTVGVGQAVTITAEDTAGSIVLDEQTFEVEGEGTATQLTKIVNANNAAATLTLEGTSSRMNQDVTSDANVTFNSIDCVADIDTPLVTNDSADLTLSTTTSGNININAVDSIVKINSASATNATTQTFKFGDDTGGITGIRNINGELQYNSGGAGWSSFNSEGGINYIANGMAEADTTGWTTYADAAGTVPVDGSGAGATVTWGRNAVSPLRSAGDFLFTKDANNRQGEGVSYDFDIDIADIHSVLSITFDVTTSANYVGNDMIVYIYNKDSTRLIEPVSRGIKAGKNGRYFAQFQTDGGVDNSYRLIFHVSTVNANAYTLNIDNIKVSPSVVNFGAPITDWSAYTPVSNWSANVAWTGRWMRVGKNMECMVYALASGATNAGDLTISLPSGYAIDTGDILNTTTQQGAFGTAYLLDAGTNSFFGFVSYASSTTVTVREVTEGAAGATIVSNTNPFTIANGDKLFAKFSVPILGWGSTVQCSDRDETRLVAARYSSSDATVIGTASSTILNFDDKSEDTHNAVTVGTWKFTAPCSGFYPVLVCVRGAFAAGDWDDGEAIDLRLYKNGAEYALIDDQKATASSAAAITITLSGCAGVYLNKGDYIDVRLYHSAGANFTLTAASAYQHIFIYKLAGPSAIAANELVAAKYDTDAGQSISGAGAANTINFDSVTFGYDSHGSVIPGATWKFICPVGGTYSVKTLISLVANAGWGAGEVQLLTLYKNNTLESWLFYQEMQAAGTLAITMSGSTELRLNVGDYIDVRLVQTSGGAILLSATEEANWIAIHRIGF